MPRGQDSRNHPNRRIQRTEGGQVGTYMGSVGGTHMFSSESTGGGATDSLSVMQGSQPGSNLVAGQKYSISGKTTDFVKPV